MASAAPIIDLTSDTLDLAAQRAAELREAGADALHAVADQLDVEVAKTHRLRTALIGLVVIALIVVVVKKVTGGGDDDPTRP